MIRSPTPFAPPAGLLRTVKSRAPVRTASENWGRSGGFYGGEDLTTRGYGAVIVYVRKGLGRMEAILPVVEFVLTVQRGVCRRWPLVPLSHGWGEDLKHPGRGFDMGYTSDAFAAPRIAETLCALAGTDLEAGPAVIAALFPPTGPYNLYHGKISVSRDDLLVFVDLEGQLVFHRRLMGRLRANDLQRMVFVHAPETLDSTRWIQPRGDLAFAPPARDKETT
ncbi:MAG: hypothetical protein R6X35_03405 [Candidatus Krumholzibacteriia bacterium]